MSYKQKSPFNSFRDPKRPVRNFKPTEFKMPDLSPIVNKTADGTGVTDDRKTDNSGEKGKGELSSVNTAMDKINSNKKAIVEKEKPEHIKIRERYAADKAQEKAAFKQIRKNSRLADKKTTAEEKDKFARDKMKMQEAKFNKSRGRKKEQEKSARFLSDWVDEAAEADNFVQPTSSLTKNIGQVLGDVTDKMAVSKNPASNKETYVEKLNKQNKIANSDERAQMDFDRTQPLPKRTSTTEFKNKMRELKNPGKLDVKFKNKKELKIVDSIDDIGGDFDESNYFGNIDPQTGNRMKFQRYMNSPLNMNSRSKIEKSGEVKKQNNFSSGRGSFKLKSPFGVVTEEESFQPEEGGKFSKGDPTSKSKPKPEIKTKSKDVVSDPGIKSSAPAAPVVSPPKVDPPKADPPKAAPPKAAPTGVGGPKSESPSIADPTTTKAPTSESPANKLNEITQQSTNRSQGTQIAQTRSGQGSVIQESMGQPQEGSSSFSSENEKANFNTGSSSNKAAQVAATMSNARNSSSTQQSQTQNIITPTSGFFSGQMGVNPNTTSGVGNDIKNTTGYSKQIEAANQTTKQQAIDNLAKNPNAQTPGGKPINQEAMGTPTKQPPVSKAPVTSPPPPPPPPPVNQPVQGQNNCGNASSSREAQFLNNAMPMFSTMKSMGPNKALQGDQHKLPEHLKKAIYKSPGMYDNV